MQFSDVLQGFEVQEGSCVRFAGVERLRIAEGGGTQASRACGLYMGKCCCEAQASLKMGLSVS